MRAFSRLALLFIFIQLFSPYLCSQNQWQKLNGPFGGSVRHFYEVNGKIYVVTDREIYRLSDSGWVSLNFYKNFQNSTYSLKICNSGRILAGGDWGLYYTDDDGNNWNPIYDDTQSELAVSNFCTLENGDLLLATYKGIYKLDIGSLKASRFALDKFNVNSLSIDKSGYLWAATTQGLLKTHQGNLIWESTDLKDPDCRKIVFDSSGTIYIYSSSSLYKSSDEGKTWLHMDMGYITDITLNKNNELLVTLFDRIVLVDSAGPIWESAVPDIHLLTAFLTSGNEIFVGTLGRGVLKYDRNSDSFSEFNSGLNSMTIRGLASTSKGTIIATTDACIIYISRDNGESWEQSKKCWANSIKVTSDNSIYVGASPSIIKTTDEGKNWTTLKLDVLPYFISAFDVSDDNRTIVAGTSTGKVFVSDDGGINFRLIKNENRYFVDAVKIVNKNTYLFYNDSLYVTTDAGKTLKTVKIENFSGIPCFALGKDKKIYMGSFSGIYNSRDGVNWKLVNKQDAAYLETDSLGNFYSPAWDGAKVSVDDGVNWERTGGFVSNSILRSFILSPNGYLFYGTQNGGLYRQQISFKQHKAVYNYDYFISQNFPNPFNNETKIDYEIPEAGFVTLKVYDILGREIKTLVSEFREKGSCTAMWNARDFASGIYIYRIDYNNKSIIKKMNLIK